MSFQSDLAQIEMLAWRDNALIDASDQLEKNFPALIDRLMAEVDKANITDVAFSTEDLTSSAQDVMKEWSDEQLKIASSHAKTSLEETLQDLSGIMNLDRDGWDNLYVGLSIAATILAIGGAIVAIPVLAPFIIGKSLISAGLLTLITGKTFATSLSLALATVVSSAAAGVTSFNQIPKNFKSKLRQEAARLVFGIGNNSENQDPEDQPLLHVIRTTILEVEQTQIKERAKQ